MKSAEEWLREYRQQITDLCLSGGGIEDIVGFDEINIQHRRKIQCDTIDACVAKLTTNAEWYKDKLAEHYWSDPSSAQNELALLRSLISKLRALKEEVG
jgi:hypothetical protein